MKKRVAGLDWKDDAGLEARLRHLSTPIPKGNELPVLRFSRVDSASADSDTLELSNPRSVIQSHHFLYILQELYSRTCNFSDALGQKNLRLWRTPEERDELFLEVIKGFKHGILSLEEAMFFIAPDDFLLFVDEVVAFCDDFSVHFDGITLPHVKPDRTPTFLGDRIGLAVHRGEISKRTANRFFGFIEKRKNNFPKIDLLRNSSRTLESTYLSFPEFTSYPDPMAAFIQQEQLKNLEEAIKLISRIHRLFCPSPSERFPYNEKNSQDALALRMSGAIGVRTLELFLSTEIDSINNKKNERKKKSNSLEAQHEKPSDPVPEPGPEETDRALVALGYRVGALMTDDVRQLYGGVSKRSAHDRMKRITQKAPGFFTGAPERQMTRKHRIPHQGVRLFLAYRNGYITERMMRRFFDLQEDTPLAASLGRWHPDAVKMYKTGKITLEEIQLIFGCSDFIGIVHVVAQQTLLHPETLKELHFRRSSKMEDAKLQRKWVVELYKDSLISIEVAQLFLGSSSINALRQSVFRKKARLNGELESADVRKRTILHKDDVEIAKAWYGGSLTVREEVFELLKEKGKSRPEVRSVDNAMKRIAAIRKEFSSLFKGFRYHPKRRPRKRKK